MPARRSLRHLNVSELAEVSGLSPATVSARLNAAGIAPAQVIGKRKLFDAPQAMRLLLGNDDLDGRVEKARLDCARADLTELEVAEKRGDLIPRADHEASVLALCSGVAQRMRSIPSKAAPEARIVASDVEAEEILRDHIDQALGELAATGDELQKRAALARSRDDGNRTRTRGAKATAKKNGRAVGGRRTRPVDGKRRRARPLED